MVERGRTWTDEEVKELLSIWGEDSIQRQLLGSVRNVIPFRKIAEELQRRTGLERTYQQCREKIKTLKKKYKDARGRLRRSGVGVDSDDDLEDYEIYVNFKWFAEIPCVMGRRAVVTPPVLLDTSSMTSDDRGSTVNSTSEGTLDSDNLLSSPITPEPPDVPSNVQVSAIIPTTLTVVNNDIGTVPGDADTMTTTQTTGSTATATTTTSSTTGSTSPTTTNTFPTTGSTASTSTVTPTSPTTGSTASTTTTTTSPTTGSTSTTTTTIVTTTPTITRRSMTSNSRDKEQPGPSKKRKTTKMEKVEKSNTAMMNLLLSSQAEARKEMLQLEKKRMEQEEKLAKMENERNNQFMIFMKDMFPMMFQGPPLTPPSAGTMYYPPGPVSLPTPMYLTPETNTSTSNVNPTFTPNTSGSQSIDSPHDEP